MLREMWSKRSPLILLVGMYIGAATMENSMEVPQKAENRVDMIQQLHSWAYTQTKQ